MKHYSIEPRDRMFLKGYGFLSFSQKVGKNKGKKYKRKFKW